VYEHGEHYYDEDDPARYGLDGTCEGCGMDLDADPLGAHDAWHSLCWRCYRGQNDDDDEREGSR
jgi:hypothetical protein